MKQAGSHIFVFSMFKMILVLKELCTFHIGVKDMKTRSHTDNFGENNVKCLIAKGICRFVPHSSAGGF